jgi:hypothetical protein
MCLLLPGFIITGMIYVLNMDLGPKKWKKFVYYNCDLAITELAIKFHYRWKRTNSVAIMSMSNTLATFVNIVSTDVANVTTVTYMMCNEKIKILW